MAKWFKDIKTLEELKKLYHKLIMKYHPDRGGDKATAQQIISEYEEVFERVKNTHYSAKNERFYEKKTDEVPQEFINIIEQLIHMDGVVAEIVGCFVWLSGNTKPYKELLKSMGFKWHSKKLMWYLAPKGYKPSAPNMFSYDEIKSYYGVRGRYEGKRKEEDELKALTA